MTKNKVQKNIPNTWKIKQIQEFAETSSGGTPKSTEEIYYKNGKIPWLKSGEVRKGKIFEFNNFITKEGLENSSAKLFPKKTVLVAMYGITAGQIGILEKEASTNQALCGILPNREYCSDYLFNFLQTRTEHLLKMGAGAAQPNISQEIIKTYDVKFPPLPEQKWIVGVLEVWDEGIEKLERKIEIKEDIKKGLMQKLLTGKKRLSGFSGEWKKVQIGKLLDYEQPTNYIVDSTDYEDEFKTPVLTAGKTFILGYINEENNIFPKEKLPVIIFDDFTTANKFVDFEFKVKSSAMKILKNKDENISDIIFIFGAMQLLNFQVGEHKRNYLSEYQYLDINLPSLKEQKAIAEVLITADEEIEILQKKLEILKDQKKFLLNNLVTGNIRVSE